MDRNQSKNIIINSIRLIRKCPSCNSAYTEKDVKIIEQTDEGVLLHFSCSACSCSLLAQVSELPFGIVGSAMLTDLESGEVLKFKNEGEVVIDDVLEVYQELEKRN